MNRLVQDTYGVISARCRASAAAAYPEAFPGHFHATPHLQKAVMRKCLGSRRHQAPCCAAAAAEGSTTTSCPRPSFDTLHS